MANNKQVRIFLSRKITLERHDRDPVKLNQGANLVDADVAEHGFVKAHIVEGSDVEPVDAALQARVAELTAANDAGAKQLRDALNRADAAEQKVAELTAANQAAEQKVDDQAAIIQAYESTAPKSTKK